MSRNRKIGDKGEEIAINFLVDNNYEILEKNWTTGHKEIDIICKQNGIYIFVEVKTRKNIKMGMPETAVNDKKIKNITEASQLYLLDKKNYNDVRFDVISIILFENDLFEILHIKDAFY